MPHTRNASADTARFRFAAEILRRLGEELNPSADVGVLELVKNAYDADAPSCTVSLRDTDRPGGTLVVEDDGRGLTREDIVDGWLVLGRSTKAVGTTTPGGRAWAGSKGLGRLAALRMGRRATLRTWPAGQAVQHDVVLEWDAFDRAGTVDAVEIPITTTSRPPGQSNGTVITVEGLRERVGRMDVKRLARSLLLLADPFDGGVSGFAPVLKAPEYADLEALVRRRYFAEAEFHLDATLDEHGRAFGRVLDFRGEVLFSAQHDEIRKEDGAAVYHLGETRLELWEFPLSPQVFRSRRVGLEEVREWLRNFGGVHLYVNSLRISPYGNPGNDWLDLNLARAKSPEGRPSTNNSIGRVTVRDADGALPQKTDRSGLVDTPAFDELRGFCHDVLEWMNDRRMAVLNEQRRRARQEAQQVEQRSRRALAQRLEEAPGQLGEDLRADFRAYEVDQQRQIDQLRKEVQLYRTLSTAGITAATFAHESEGSPLKVLHHATNTVERRAKKLAGTDFAGSFGDLFTLVRGALASLEVLSSTTLNLLRRDKRRYGTIELRPVIEGLLHAYEPFLRGRDVTLVTDYAPGTLRVLGSEAALESIVTNLLNNSLNALIASSADERRVRITTRAEQDCAVIAVADNGPGVDDAMLTRIWTAGETTQPDGTGLGLTIVQDTVTDLGGRVSVVGRGADGGAEFTVRVPLHRHERDGAS